MKVERKVLPLILALSMFIVVSVVAKPNDLQLDEGGIKYTTYKMPCLTVSEMYGGKLSYLPISITREKADVPLRVMIVDDTPNGSGQTIHSSIWMASLLAAMLRNDTMHGVTITVEFTGNVDGPSAGGVTCLTILSALDGLPLPTDFAMTGTILPDGTIGIVGGVPDKMRAAAQAGVKRLFIPAFQRIVQEKDGDTVKDIDLQSLADELNIELHFVENIFEAYSILHNRPWNRNSSTNIRQVTRLPKKSETVLVEYYNKYLSLITERVKKSPEDAKIVISEGYALSPTLARSFYQEGKLQPAAITIFHCWQAWQALDKACAFLDKFSLKKPDWSKIEYLKEYHLRKQILALQEDIDEFAKQSNDEKLDRQKEYYEHYFGIKDGKEMVGYFPNSNTMTEITAQLEPIGMEERLLGELDTFFSRRLTKEQLERASLKELEEAWANDIDTLYLLSLLTLDDTEYTDFLRDFGETLPKLKATSRAKEVERLFFSAAAAVDAVASDNYRASAESASAESEDLQQDDLYNPILNPYFRLSYNAASFHRLLLPDSPEKPTNEEYHLQASLKANIGQFAMASALVVWYGPDRSNDFLPQLWRIARSSAMHNISECIAAGIPCYSAIYDFEIGEASINANDSPIWGLISYWKASLYSKALMMSFK